MNNLSILLCLLALPAHATDPPDWYAHIPADQRAALLATRHAVAPYALIASGSVQGWRGPASAAYSAPANFDASALVHPPQYNLHHHNRRQAIVRAMLRGYRTPDDSLARCWRVGKRDRL